MIVAKVQYKVEDPSFIESILWSNNVPMPLGEVVHQRLNGDVPEFTEMGEGGKTSCPLLINQSEYQVFHTIFFFVINEI